MSNERRDLLLEVGTEEMPAGAIAQALEQLADKARARMSEVRLAPEAVHVCGTPRRLILQASGVPARQEDLAREVKGPAKSVAFDAGGNPTGAAIGFARKQGVPVEALELQSTPQGEYVVAKVVDAGRPAGEVLGPLLAEVVTSLYFPKRMKWGEVGLNFVRPVRWIACLLGDEVVPMEIAGVRSGRESRGHRFLAPSSFAIDSPSGFLDRLHAAKVEPEAEARRAEIRRQADALAAGAGGRIPWDEGLLDENTWLVEWPTALLGSFDPKYLELPRPVLITAMKKHQRFFPVEGAAGTMLPHFVSIRNGGDQGLDLVREGNERVLTARFSDAAYFFEQDKKLRLEEFLPKLDRILFQEKLGTLAQKVARLELLTRALGGDYAVRAARLCKADLASQMVMELPALQGVIGREYALRDGEDPAVADAIAQHYLPKSADDAIPSSALGRILAVADRVDTLVGYLGLGITPSGSSDPYGLRRAAHGVIQILAETEVATLTDLTSQATAAYGQVNEMSFGGAAVAEALAGLFTQRMDAYLQDRGVRYDLIDATLSGGAAFSQPVAAVVKRAETLRELSGDGDWEATVTVAGRVANILRSQPPSEQAVDSARLVHESELALLQAAEEVGPSVERLTAERDFAGAYRALVPLRPAVDGFFDDVLVMDPDPAVRANRLALITSVDVLYKSLADFTKVVVT